MFSIGEFARLGTVSVRTLRHYEEIGLLLPARVDPETGYRCYSPAQLGQLNRIIALKELGFSLAQAKQLLTGITLQDAPDQVPPGLVLPGTGKAERRVPAVSRATHTTAISVLAAKHPNGLLRKLGECVWQVALTPCHVQVRL